MTAPRLRRLLIVCFFASGAAALIYQVAWVRLLTLALGHTVAAASTVLAAFMGGLAVGAWAAGRTPFARTSTLSAYAALELFIAVAAIALPAALAACDPLLVWAYADGTTPASFAIARIAVSVALVGIPAAAMGATYPLAVAWLSRLEPGDANDPRPAAVAAGALYAANAAGAAAGAMAAGFWLIESLGIRGTTWVAVALNTAAAGLALWFGQPARAPTAARAAPPTPRRAHRTGRAERTPLPPRPALAAIAVALSGFAALVYEVTWTRLLALILGPTTYAFATMAASFIAGIALGSSLGTRVSRRNTGVAFWLGAMLAATALSTMLAAWFAASYLPLVIARDVATHTEYDWLFVRQTLLVALLLLPASVSLGATFALALATASSGTQSAARQTARVYTANTVGAVAGALAAGFVFVPRFGLQTTFLYTSAALLRSRKRCRPRIRKSARSTCGSLPTDWTEKCDRSALA
jgi:spermidine synthase